MNKRVVTWLVPGLVALFGASTMALVYLSLQRGPVAAIRVPGLDGAEQAAAAAAAGIPNFRAGTLEAGAGKSAGQLPGAWPYYRGSNYDNIAADPTPLLHALPPEGPKVEWIIPVGDGYAAPVVLSGRVFLVDHDAKAQRDVIRCLSLADGRDIWRYSYPAVVEGPHGQSRTVPAVTEKHLVTFGPRCHVYCFDPETGAVKWSLDLVGEFGATVPPWHAGQCPFIDGDKVILGVGGPQALLMAVELATGKVVWKSPNPGNWAMTHVSVSAMELDGQRTYVYCGKGGVAGIAADDGRVLWSTTDWKIGMATVPSPVILPGKRVFLSGGYGAGSMMLRIDKTDSGYQAVALFRLTADVFGSNQSTPIYYQGHIYGVRPDGSLVCMNPDGQVLWTSSAEVSFGLGPYLIADGMVLVLNDTGTLTLVEATAGGYRQLGQAAVVPGKDAWGPMALVGGRLLLRNFRQLACVAMGKP